MSTIHKYRNEWGPDTEQMAGLQWYVSVKTQQVCNMCGETGASQVVCEGVNMTVYTRYTRPDTASATLRYTL